MNHHITTRDTEDLFRQHHNMNITYRCQWAS